MAKKKTIDVQGTSIKLLTNKENDYISLTDIDTKFDGKGRHIENWFRNQNTIEYLAVWEELNNPDFNSIQLHGIKEERVHKLNEIAIYQMQVLVNVTTPMLKGLTDEKI